jgi:hypothetical protein
MDDHIIEIDSSQRDPVLFPSPSDYTVFLNKPLYNVETLELVTGKIPTTQYTINSGNKQFQVDGRVIVLTERSYLSGADLASNLQDSFIQYASNVDSVTFNSNTFALTFSNLLGTSPFSFKFYSGSNGFTSQSAVGTPCNVLGFAPVDTTPTIQLTSGVIELIGQTNVILRITTNGDDCKKKVYTTNDAFSFNSNTWASTNVSTMNNIYMGRLITFKDHHCNMIDYKPGDVVKYTFDKGTAKYVQSLRIRWYYNLGNKLVAYDFNNRNHFIKLKIKGSTDKLSGLPKELKPIADEEEDPPVQVVEEAEETEEVEKPVLHSRTRVIITSLVILALIMFIVLRRIRQVTTS